MNARTNHRYKLAETMNFECERRTVFDVLFKLVCLFICLIGLHHCLCIFCVFTFSIYGIFCIIGNVEYFFL